MEHDALSFVATGQQCQRFTFDALLHDGDHPAPGRASTSAWCAAPGHDLHREVTLLAPGPRILISGDALWENGFGVIFPELDGESGFAEQAAVLARIAELDARLVILGHGRVFGDVRGGGARAGPAGPPARRPAAQRQPRGEGAGEVLLLEQQSMSRTALLA